MILFVKAIEEKIRETARELHNFIMEHAEFEALDSDETIEIVSLLRLELDWLNGNLTLTEYEKELTLLIDQSGR
jgi:hypothetical protein